VLLATLEGQAVREEIRVLIRHYGGARRRADLLAMARLLDAAAPGFAVGGGRLHLWASALRAEAGLAEP
jgi:hypothetical protein